MSVDYKNLLEELIKSRDLIESSLKQSILELEQLGVSPNDSLLDSEGYPRGDLDLYRVRTLKSSIASNNDKYYHSIRLIHS